jgi:GYF domain 2
MAEAWFYVDASNAQAGPCTPPQLADLFSKGTVHDGTLVWKDGQPGWVALASLPSLASQARGAAANPSLDDEFHTRLARFLE